MQQPVHSSYVPCAKGAKDAFDLLTFLMKDEIIRTTL